MYFTFVFSLGNSENASQLRPNLIYYFSRISYIIFTLSESLYTLFLAKLLFMYAQLYLGSLNTEEEKLLTILQLKILFQTLSSRILHTEAYRMLITALEHFRELCQMQMTSCSISSVTNTETWACCIGFVPVPPLPRSAGNE
jgi:hypothetical protein